MLKPCFDNLLLSVVDLPKITFCVSPGRQSYCIGGLAPNRGLSDTRKEVKNMVWLLCLAAPKPVKSSLTSLLFPNSRSKLLWAVRP